MPSTSLGDVRSEAVLDTDDDDDDAIDASFDTSDIGLKRNSNKRPVIPNLG